MQAQKRYHRLQPRGGSISTYNELAVDEKTPPASAAWSFNLNLNFWKADPSRS